ncbi:MAG TPA: alkane 1-monooxygenase [Aquabacterium sp.]|uniref:alkane 1-monooxygenase n=1 Tax=Aquabacterium sp. TaxID=1872578 RepID=UPI002E30B7BC|nr:alkane 1-monooxygenase [Aquabacterium sp.]HEX5372120.1 alkane 1-monooxygenase [Aquabacterium sp.]
MTSTVKPTTEDWSDKRYLWLFSPAVPLLALISLIGFHYYGHSVWVWIVPMVIHLLIPVLDYTFGEDFSNPPESAVAMLDKDFFYTFLVILFVPFQLSGTIFGAYLVATHDLAWYEMLGLILSVGGFNGIGIATAHELGHKKEALEQWLAKITLAPTCYGHFYVEHNWGHHKRVSTPEDPASSRLGESFWAFLPRTVIGALRSGWHLEAERLARQGRGVWNIRNNNLQAWAMSVLLFGGLVAWLGWAVLPFLILQAMYGASLLEVVNYVEHYGLLRKKDASGKYERCQPEHSWNSNHIVGNILLYHLQRHSDHHAHPTRRYQALRHFEESPQLPSGYAAMITAAYCPPLWFALMNDRVMRHYGGDLSRVNVHPSARAAMEARYGRKGQASHAS